MIKNINLNKLAKNLRNNMTEQERKLWYCFLRDYKYTINRQFIIGNYIVDFYCHSKKIVIEIDGGQHYEEENITYDNQRTKYLNSLGIKVLRFSNLDINNNFENVKEEIDLVFTGKKQTIS